MALHQACGDLQICLHIGLVHHDACPTATVAQIDKIALILTVVVYDRHSTMKDPLINHLSYLALAHSTMGSCSNEDCYIFRLIPYRKQRL